MGLREDDLADEEGGQSLHGVGVEHPCSRYRDEGEAAVGFPSAEES